MNLESRVIDFYNSLEEFKADHHPSWQTGQIFNAILGAAKEEFGDDPVIQTISPAEERMTGPGVMGKPIASIDAGTMRAVMNQIASALGASGPTIG